MAKITLPTNYRDDILNSSAEGKRKYVMSYNQDGTVSFEDVTPYEQVGSDFGAGDINTANEAINQSFDKNKLIRDLDTINALTEEGFAPDALAVKQLNESLDELKENSFSGDYTLISSKISLNDSVKDVIVQDVTQYKSIYFVMYADFGPNSSIFPTFLLLNSRSNEPLRVISSNANATSIRVAEIYIETNTLLKVKMSGGSGWSLEIYGVK